MQTGTLFGLLARTARLPAWLSALTGLVLAAQLSVVHAADTDRCLAAHERAQVARLGGRYLEAREALRVCAQRGCPRLVGGDCAKWLGELEATLPTVVFAVTDAAGRDLVDARVLVDGKPLEAALDGHAVPLDPGLYAVRFEAEGYAPAEQSLSVREGEKSRLVRGTLAPLPASTSREPAALPPTQRADTSVAAAAGRAQHEDLGRRTHRLRVATYTLGAAGAAALLVTAGSGLRGYRILKNDCEGAEVGWCSEETEAHGKQLFRTANVSAAIGGALLITATITLVRALRGASAHEHARGSEPWLAVAAGRSGAQLQLSKRW